MNREEAIAILNHKVSACLHGTEWGEALEMAIKALSYFPYVKYTENGMEPDFDMANAFFNFDAPMVANANQHNSNTSRDDGQRKNALEGDAINRRAVLEGLASIAKAKAKSDAQKALMGRVMFFTEHLPPVKSATQDGALDR